MKRIAVVGCVALAGLTLGAKTVYVDCQMGDYTGHDGTKPELALETIQEGVNKTADGDLVLVAPGVYDKGLGRGNDVTYDETGKRLTGHWWLKSRIAIGNRKITIRSTKGAAETHIVGQRDTTTASGYGMNTVRCIDAERGVSSTSPAIIEGFTIRDGSTNNSGDCPGQGGILMASSGSNDGARNVYIVDCVISNCQSAGTAIMGGTFVRCLFADNRLTYAGRDMWFCRDSSFLNCVFTRNEQRDPDTGAYRNGSVYFNSSSSTSYTKFVNCTFADNRAQWWNHNYAHWYNCLCSMSRIPTDDGAYGAGGCQLNLCRDSTAKRILMAPSLGDWRVRKGGEAETAGDPQYLTDETIIPLPEGVERLKDIRGNAIDVSGTTICAGAVQEVVEQKGGAIVSPSTIISFDGRKATHYSEGYVCSSTYPTNYALAFDLSGSQRINFLSFSPAVDDRDWMMPNDYLHERHWMMPPPGKDDVITVNYDNNNRIVYADANSTESAELQDGTPEHPFSTLQAAIDGTTEYNLVVIARPGVYDKGYGTRSWTGEGVTMKARVVFSSRRIRLIGEQGPEKTVIVGAPDPDNLPEDGGDGCGAGATMVVAMDGNSSIQGFTLTGGYSGPGAWDASGRGAIYSYGTDLHVTDCIITNNHGRNQAIGTARFERCYIADNTGAKGLAIGATMVSCVIGNNTVTDQEAYVLEDTGAYFPLRLYNCSFLGDGVHSTWRDWSAYTRRINLACSGCSGTAFAIGTTAGCVASGFSTFESGVGCLNADPMFADASLEARDYRLFSRSPALTAAVSPAGDPSATWWLYCPVDFNGVPWKFDAEGRPVAGAVQGTASGGVYVAKVPGLTVASGGTTGFNALEPGETITIGYAAGAHRPLVGLAVNGVTNLVTGTFSYTADGTDVGIDAVYGDSWFVDAVNGSDTEKFGYNAACGFKTLKKALENPDLRGGDKVVALPGTYREETMSIGDSYAVKARAVVPAKVTLESRDGAAVTFIEGKPSDVDDHSTNERYNEYIHGMGKNAVRGVYLREGAVVRGFTVTNCYVRGATDAGGGGHNSLDHCGAGVAGGSGRAERCVFVDCHAFRGGGTWSTPSVDCVFHHNLALYGGGATTDAKQYGCVSYDNVCVGTTYWGGFFYWQVVDNCTVADSVSGCMAGKGYAMRNTLVTGYIGNWDIAPTSEWFTNCVVDVAKTVSAAYMTAIAGGVGCIVTNAAALQVDEDFRPVVGANAAIDMADETISLYVTDTDVLGGQRVYNGRRDVGALEADWRPVYAADIRRKQLTVETASPGVTESEAKGVLLPDATELTGTLTARDAAEYLFEAKVPAGGTLTLTFNGEAVEPVAGEDGRMQYVVNAAAGDNELAFAYAGEGSAEILRSHKNSGMYLFVR